MGSVFRKSVTRPLPANAEIIIRKGQRVAKYTDRAGKQRTAPVITGKNGLDRISVTSPFFIAKYRDGSGALVEESTHCRHEDAARRVLGDLERKAELIRAGIMTTAEATVGKHQSAPLAEHIAAYDEHHQAKGSAKIHRVDTGRYLRRLAADCSFATLADLRRDALERWLALRTADGMSARSRNAYRTAMVSFCNWAVKTGRMATNLFDRIAMANEKADPRRQRRAMTEPELIKLLAVARDRPLQEALTIRRGKRRGEESAQVRPEVRERLERLGRERALIYKTLVLTGLRKGELTSLTVASLSLTGPSPTAHLKAADEKNREGNAIGLRTDLAADLAAWLADKLARLQSDARAIGDPIPAKLPPTTPLFTVPVELSRILNRDLKRAGIAKRDERGRVIDVHAMRTTFGTLLSAGGVAPRTAQAAMRHSDISLTMGVYTDPKLLEVRTALDALPCLPLTERGEGASVVAPTVAPLVAPDWCNRSQSLTFPDKARVSGKNRPIDVSGDSVKGKGLLTSPVSSPVVTGELGFEPRRTDPESVVLPLHYSPFQLSQ